MIFGLPRSAHRNPKYWAKPNEFYPEHFLDADGKLRQKVETAVFVAIETSGASSGEFPGNS